MLRSLRSFLPFSARTNANPTSGSSLPASSERGSRNALSSTRSNRSRPARASNQSQSSVGIAVARSTVSSLPAQTSRERFMPLFRYPHALMVLVAIGIVFISIVLAGCTRNGLRDVYLLSLSYNDYPTSSGGNGSTALESSMSNQTKSLELRVGFLGACIELASEWTCSPAFSAITDRLSEIQFDANEDALSESYDPLGLLNVGKSFKDKVVFDGLMYIAVGCNFVAFCLLPTFPSARNQLSSEAREESSTGERDSETQAKKRPMLLDSRTHVAHWFTLVAAVMTLLSVFWQHLGSAGAATMIEALTDGAVKTSLGSVSMGLGWATVVLNFVIFAGLRLRILSIRILSRLSD